MSEYIGTELCIKVQFKDTSLASSTQEQFNLVQKVMNFLLKEGYKINDVQGRGLKRDENT